MAASKKNNIGIESVRWHKKYGGKLGTYSKVPLKNKHDLSLAYTPGVAQVSLELAKDPKKASILSLKKNSLAVISDGSKVLGLGNLGAYGAIPVMEGKCVLFKELGGIDAFPICIQTQKVDEIISIIRNIAPVFGAINLEDIAAPNCFKVEAALQDLGIPVFHDDQHGTAIVVYAALLNASKAIKKPFSSLRVCVNGAGAAGNAITKMLLGKDLPKSALRVKEVIVCDSTGIIFRGRKGLNAEKKELSKITNPRNKKGLLNDAVLKVDVLIGVSVANQFTPEMIRSMAPNAIVFAMANPAPEIMPDAALKAGAVIVGTGRSDFSNQVNNALVFPGIFRGAMDAHAMHITPKMGLAAAYALAGMIKFPSSQNILPSLSNRRVARVVAAAVKQAALR